MQYLTDDTILALKTGKLVNVSMSVVTTSSQTFTITNADIVSGSFSIDRNSVSGSDIEIGNVETSELTFKIINTDGKFSTYKFEGATITVTFTVNGESFSGGVYTIDNKPAKRDVFTITALDNMVKLNMRYKSSLGMTATLQEIINDIATTCGVTIFIPNSVWGLNYVANVPHGMVTTHHEVLAWATELCGVNAFADHTGTICLGWYGEYQINTALTESILPAQLPFKLGKTDIVIPITSAERFNYEDSETYLTMTGVEYDNGNDDPIIVQDESATTQRHFVIGENPLLNVDTVTTVLNTIYGRINGFSYRPFNAEIVGYPHLWQMDVVTITPPNGTAYSGIITGHEYVLNGKSIIEAVGKSETESGYASPMQLSSTQVSAVKSYSYQQATVKVNEYDETIMTATSALNAAQGFYETKILDANGVLTEYYQHDQPLLEDSLLITKITAGTMEKSRDGGATYTTSISADGATIPQLTARIIYADLINTDKLIANELTNSEDSTFYTTIGDITEDSVKYRGLFGYNSSISTTNSIFKLVSYVTGTVSTGLKTLQLRLMGNPNDSMFYMQNNMDTDVQFAGISVISNSATNEPSIGITMDRRPTNGTIILRYDKLGSNGHQLGIDATGPFKVVNGVKTYL